MIILSIETSCDETGISLLRGEGETISVQGNALASQIELHAKYGGVFPAMAKRAHTEKIITLLQEALEQAAMLIPAISKVPDDIKKDIQAICDHEEGLAESIIAFAETYQIPAIDCIGVTAGPGLEPALWVGINTAMALSKLWQKPLYPINHMEGHVIAALLQQEDPKTFHIPALQYPGISLLVSGGHTELVLLDASLSYKKIGQTKDDAVGEAFDKVARMLGLPYPGGPKISALAAEARASNLIPEFKLPRPMLHTNTYDFSFSGLKTAVLYLIRDLQKENPDILQDITIQKKIAREFEDAAIEVLVSKTVHAVQDLGAQTVVVGGGVAANNFLRSEITRQIAQQFGIVVLFPTRELSTDNSIMIGMALYYELLRGTIKAVEHIRVDGNLSIETV